MVTSYLEINIDNETSFPDFTLRALCFYIGFSFGCLPLEIRDIPNCLNLNASQYYQPSLCSSQQAQHT